jgi:bifunctional DNA-binding transcriptional regulator/antitoxin component of YhaV-PrlF toxin-antitoxin module
VDKKILTKDDLSSFIAKLDSKGRISIPALVRSKYKLESGKFVSLKLRGDEI